MGQISGENELHAAILGSAMVVGVSLVRNLPMAFPMSSRSLSTTDIKERRAWFLALHVTGKLHRMHAIGAHEYL